MKNILLKVGEDVPSSATLNYTSGEYLFYEYTKDDRKQQSEFRVSDNWHINGPGYYAFRSTWANSTDASLFLQVSTWKTKWPNSESIIGTFISTVPMKRASSLTINRVRNSGFRLA